MAIENLLDLKDALAPELVLAPLLGLLGVRAHQLCSSVRKLWNPKGLSLWWLLLLDLGIVDRLEKIVLSLRSIDVLGLVKVDILAIHLHLVRIVTAHRCVHLHLFVLVNDLPPLGLHPRLTHGGDEDAARASPFLGCKKQNGY